MGKNLKQLQNIIKLGFSVRSGVYSALDDRITMRLDEQGQYEYVLPKYLSETEAARLLKVDNMSDISPNEDEVADRLFSDIADIKKDSILGYYKELYVGYVKEGNYRKNGTSGGLTTWVLKELHKRREIDGVIHVKPLNPDDNDGKLFKYVISRTVNDIERGAKSRYYPMELSEVLRIVKKEPGKYAVVGIPEFIMELRLLTLIDPTIKERVVYFLGLVCGHQKSARYAESMSWEYGIKPGNIKEIDFRVKRDEGPAWDYLTEFKGPIEGRLKTFSKLRVELFSGDWSHGMFKTKFSDYTDNAFNEVADITLGDAWLREYAADPRGTNIVIVRNEKISEIIKDGLGSNKLYLEAVEPDTIINSQRGLVRHTKEELAYRLYKLQRRGKWFPKKRINPSNRFTKQRRRIQEVREQLATKSHIYFVDAIKKDDFSYFKKKMMPNVERYKNYYASSTTEASFINRLRKKLSPRAKLVSLKRKLRIRTRFRYIRALRKNDKLLYDLLKKVFLLRFRRRRVFVFGAPFHSNLGDQAQTYCTEMWFKKRIRGSHVVSIDTRSALSNGGYLVRKIRSMIRKDDMIVLHSGYHTTDLWEKENELNLLVIKTFPDFHILVLPQTIYFEDKRKLIHTAEVFNEHGNITLMCRDKQSYAIGKTYFKKVRLELMPDIVTTLIGSPELDFSTDRNEGILLCFRNDKESKYGGSINDIKEVLGDLLVPIIEADTTIKADPSYLSKEREEEIKKFLRIIARNKLVITDRYHGTIFSMITNTPVIVLGSTDHKLESGVKWFTDPCFSGMIYYARTPKKAVKIAHEIYGKHDFAVKLPPYFNENYWNNLQIINKKAKMS